MASPRAISTLCGEPYSMAIPNGRVARPPRPRSGGGSRGISTPSFSRRCARSRLTGIPPSKPSAGMSTITWPIDRSPRAAARGRMSWRKYLRRHRAASTAAAAVLVSAAVGVTAVDREARLAAAERDWAQAAETKASAINAFLVNDLLTAATPDSRQIDVPTVEALLGMASRSVASAFASEPETAAEVRLTLARSYASLGNLQAAREHALAAVETFSHLQDADPLSALRARSLVAELSLEDGHYQESRQELEERTEGTDSRRGRLASRYPAHEGSAGARAPPAGRRRRRRKRDSCGVGTGEGESGRGPTAGHRVAHGPRRDPSGTG